LQRFFERAEKYILRLAVLSMVLVVLAQGAMTAEPWRWYMSWAERMEGAPVEYVVQQEAVRYSYEENAALLPGTGLVTFSIEPFSALPRSRLLVNGTERAVFSEPLVMLSVAPGDTIEIDSSYYQFPVTYKVEAVSDNLAFPEAGQSYSVQQNVVVIGKTIVK
jgi:hypothetical protein